MELIELFMVFLKVGFTSFGGMSMVPIINEEMLNHGWMNSQEIVDIVAIAEMTPGPLGINCATFAGMQVAGAVGGIVAVLGVLSPVFTTTMLVAIFYEKFKKTEVVANVLHFVRPICIGMIIAVAVNLSQVTYVVLDEVKLGVKWGNIGIGVISFVLLLKYKKPVPVIIVIAGILGAMMI